MLDRVVVPPRRPSAVSELAFCTRRPGGMGALPDVITARYGDSAICESTSEGSSWVFPQLKSHQWSAAFHSLFSSLASTLFLTFTITPAPTPNLT